MNFSTLKIYGTIPFQKDYKHTIDFESKTEQNTYFNTEFNKKGKSFNDFLYIDEYQKIIVEGAKGKFDGYNYLSFVNGDSNRTFYCFIDRFEYVSEDSTAIYFTVDVMQTYMFDYTLKESYVERMHVERWNTKDNYIIDECYTPDIVSPNSFIINNMTPIETIERHFGFLKLSFTTKGKPEAYLANQTLNELCWIIPVPLGDYNGKCIFNGHSTLSYSQIDILPNITSLIGIELLEDIGYDYRYEIKEQYVNIIVDENLLSKVSLSGTQGNTDYYYINARTNRIKTITLKTNETMYNRYSIYNTIKPKCDTNINSKYNERGEVKIFSPLFTKYKLTNLINFNEEFDVLKNDSAESITIYKHFSNAANAGIVYEIFRGNGKSSLYISNNFNRSVCYDKDSFLEYMNTNGLNDIANSSLKLLNSAITQNPLPLIGGVTGLSGMLNSAIKSNEIYSSNSPFVQAASAIGAKNYIMQYVAVNKDEIINLFKVYGYKVDKFTKINIKSRFWFNYIKTIQCNIESKLTNEIINNIKEIYNNGITFWHYNKAVYKWLDYECNNIERSIATVS